LFAFGSGFARFPDADALRCVGNCCHCPETETETEMPPFVERKCKMILFTGRAVARTLVDMIDFEWVSGCNGLACSYSYHLP